ncbi:MAG: T9SS type A sorting domain-containing protein [Crocinitomicaceae bacterium]|nr:T9SS type A sorting domain-containing protein [Crocinitomicaceae bacterium]
MYQFLKVSICSLFFLSNLAQAQVTGFLKINHMLGNDPFALDYTVQNNLSNDLQVTRLQYYVSKISIVHDGNQVTEMHDTVLALVNAADGPYTLIDLGTLNATNVEGVFLHVGVYAPLNNEDPALQDVGSPLAPQSPSMHWGWASGYRFVAFEGKGGTGFTQTFQIHVIGNENYFKTGVVPASTNLSNDSLYINLNANYIEAVRDINVSNGLMAHGSAGDAKVCILNFNNTVFGQTFVSVAENEIENTFQVYPNPTSNRAITVSSLNSDAPFDLKIYNALGKLIASYSNLSGPQFEISLPEKGIYFVQVSVQGQQPVTKKISSL